MPAGSGFRKRVEFILLVDDDADVRELYGGALRDAGFLVIEAASLSDALKTVDDRHPTFVVLDRDLPDGDGFHLARVLRERGDRARILAFTAHAEPAARVAAIEAGCHAFVRKPCAPATLIAEVRGAIARGSRRIALHAS